MASRILYVDHADLMGGAEHSLLRLMAGLDRSAYEPALACTADTPVADAAEAAGIPIYPVELKRLRHQRNRLALARTWYGGVNQLWRLIRQNEVRLVHSNVMRASLYAAPAARLAGIPFVWHVRDIHHERIYICLMSQLAQRIVAISLAVTTPLPDSVAGKTRIVPDGLDLSRFVRDETARQSARADLGVGQDELLVGNISWLSPWKQPDVFVQMARQVAEAIPDSHFVVVGAAAHPSHQEFVDTLKRQAQAALGSRCIFAGAQSDIPRVLAGLDLLVHTSRAEPLGLVIIEAMAMGLPVVAFADGGVPEIIIDGETGRLVATGDIPELASAVVDLLRSPELRMAMGVAGKSRAAAEFDVEHMVRRTEAVYAELLNMELPE